MAFMMLFGLLAIALHWNHKYGIWPEPKLQRLQIYGKVREGELFPDFTAYLTTPIQRIEVSSRKPTGKFNIYIFGNIPTCFDRECGNAGKIVLTKGGHIFTSSDPKFGLDVGLTMLLDMNRHQFADTLLSVTDSDGKIIALYRYATLDDVNDVLTELQLI